MRTFWMIVAVLIGASLGLMVFRPTPSGGARQAVIAPGSSMNDSSEDAGLTQSEPLIVDGSEMPSFTVNQPQAPVSPPASAASELASVPVGHDPARHVQATGAQGGGVQGTSGEFEPDEEFNDSGVVPLPGGLGNQLQEALRKVDESTLQDVNEPADAPDPNSLTGVTEAPKTQTGAAAMNITPSKVVKNADGTLQLDDQFVLSGSGTMEDPYIVSWDLLVSASDTYRPRHGRKDIPERIWMLHDKRVRINGFIAFPIMAQSPREMLSMLNQWDGCCIGTEPTPYDAVEVRLSANATSAQRFLRYGQVEGVLKVDPYVRGDWLLGLYLMEDAHIVDGKKLEL